MPDSLYPEPDAEDAKDESGPSTVGDETEGKGKPEGKAEGDEPDRETFLAPSSMLQDGVKPGDKCSFEVVAVHDGECELAWVKEDYGKKDRQPEMSKAMDKAFGGGVMSGADMGE